MVNRRQSAAVADLITPLSVQSLSSEEIRSNPGGNFDISKVVQVLPGVATSGTGGGSRNDRAPNENVYYLDGIEIPLINHFTTQGSAGGAFYCKVLVGKPAIGDAELMAFNLYC